MFSKIKLSLSNINYKLYFALLVLGFAPTVYTTVRVFFLGSLPGEYSFSIAGQLSWVNLLYEIINEAIILPLFYFIGKVVNDKKEFTNRVKTGMLMALGVYLVLSAVIVCFTKPLLSLMATDASIIDASATYIRIESVANLILILTQFTLVALVTINKSKYLYILTFARLVLSLVCDTFLVSSLPISLSLGVNGIGYSNIIVNIVLLCISLLLLSKESVNVFKKAKLMGFADSYIARCYKVSEVDILNHYLGISTLPILINSPFRQDKNPSVSVFINNNNNTKILQIVIRVLTVSNETRMTIWSIVSPDSASIY